MREWRQKNQQREREKRKEKEERKRWKERELSEALHNQSVIYESLFFGEGQTQGSSLPSIEWKSDPESLITRLQDSGTKFFLAREKFPLSNSWREKLGKQLDPFKDHIIFLYQKISSGGKNGGRKGWEKTSQKEREGEKEEMCERKFFEGGGGGERVKSESKKEWEGRKKYFFEEWFSTFSVGQNEMMRYTLWTGRGEKISFASRRSRDGKKWEKWER